MKYIITVFKSRSQTIKFNNILRSYNLPSVIISTPKKCGTGCGLSVKTEIATLAVIRDLLRMNSFYSFAGVFEYYENGNVRPL